MRHALERVGVNSEDAQFDIAIAKYLNSGGTIERAYERVRLAAERMSGEGQMNPGLSPLHASAQSRQSVEDARGRHAGADDGLVAHAPPSSSNRGGEGRIERAVGLRYPALPVREPTQQQRTAIHAVAKVAAITIMDTLKIDGRAIGEWTVGEARRAAHGKTRDGYILREASRVVANAGSGQRLREVVKPEEMQRIRQKAEEIADAI